LKIKISELTGKINEQWQSELINYKVKDENGDYYYINGGWDAFKVKNAD
ncbi:5846_t:CDS:1, partial [Funneliformis geosporum]